MIAVLVSIARFDLSCGTSLVFEVPYVAAAGGQERIEEEYGAINPASIAVRGTRCASIQ